MADVKKKRDKLGRVNQSEAAVPPSYKHGGKVKKSGLAKVHKGEVVVTASKAAKGKASKSSGSCKRVSAKR
jgi:hypothetical protein